ncbi:MAG TPA: hypothetical protein VK861_00590, partial [Bacteroidales bacterium]|nr:hypothetical protein [Bacteroidales bacterium]
WQKVLTKVEAILTWVEQHKRTGNEAAEKAEMRNAERALQEAIDDYLRQPSPANRCGSYGRAAGKYLEGATLLGMDPESKSALARHYAQLADECSFVFAVETHEWISNPKQKHDDGATSEEKSNLYGKIECHIPWSHFLSTGDMKVKGKGNKTLTYENHWIGDKDNQTHQTLNGNWKTDRIDGAVKAWADEFGQLHPEAHITIYWQKSVISRAWGKKPGMEKPYDFSGTDTGEEKESKSFPLKHGYEESIGNATAGMKLRVMILQAPRDDKDAPDDCF